MCASCMGRCCCVNNVIVQCYVCWVDKCSVWCEWECLWCGFVRESYWLMCCDACSHSNLLLVYVHLHFGDMVNRYG